MSEHDPRPDGEVFYRVDFYGHEIEATTENTSVHQHIGELAIYNVVLVDSHVIGVTHRQYKELAYRAILNECERHMALRAVSELFRVAYRVQNLDDLDATDTVPQEWIDKFGEDGPGSPQS